MEETCAICDCRLHRDGEYAKPTLLGRSHATSHHYVAERFFGRSTNRRGTQREGIFDSCPWGHEGETVVFCYECHEELMHNPVFLPEDIQRFAQMVRLRGFSEQMKSEDRSRIGGRIRLLQEIIAKGLDAVLAADAELSKAWANPVQQTGATVTASEPLTAQQAAPAAER
jgi:hypothetical protein